MLHYFLLFYTGILILLPLTLKLLEKWLCFYAGLNDSSVVCLYLVFRGDAYMAPNRAHNTNAHS